MDEHRREGVVGCGRSALPAARFQMSDVGASGDERSGLAAPSDAKERGLLRGGPAAGRQVCLPSGNGEVQRGNLSRVLEATQADHFTITVSRDRHCRQRQVSSRQIAQAVEAGGKQKICTRLPASLQPRAEPDRASLETDPQNLPAQSLLSTSGRCHQFGGGALLNLAQGKRHTTEIMRNYLRHYV